MSQEAAPERAVPEQPVPQVSPVPPGQHTAPSTPSTPSVTSVSAVPSVPEQQGGGAPRGLLQQMEELMAALTADLSQLDADIQSSADRQAATADHLDDHGDRP